MNRSSVHLLDRWLVADRGCCTRAIKFDQANPVTMVGGQHVETKHQPVGGVLDRLRETGFAPFSSGGLARMSRHQHRYQPCIR